MPIVASFLENILKTTPRAQHILLRVGDSFICKSMEIGVPGDGIASNLPNGFSAGEVAQSLSRGGFVIGGEQLFLGPVEEDVVMVDNYRNAVCASGAFLVFPSRRAYLFLGFMKTATQLDIPRLILRAGQELIRNKMFQEFEHMVSPPQAEEVKKFDFLEVDSCVFDGRKYPFIQQPKPYQNQKQVLLLLTTPYSPFFEFHLQRAARCPQHIHCVVVVEGVTAESLKQMTRKSYFCSQVNIAYDAPGSCAALNGQDLIYQLADLEPKPKPSPPAPKAIFVSKRDSPGGKTDAKQKEKPVEPVVISVGASFDQLNSFLVTDQLDQTPVYFGDQDLSFFGIKLNFFRQVPVDKEESFCIIFCNPKLPGFSQIVQDARKFEAVNAKVLLVLQNSWEGNIQQLIKKTPVDEKFGLLYDTNNIFGAVREIAGFARDAYWFYFERAQLIACDLDTAQLVSKAQRQLLRQKTDSEAMEATERKKKMASSRLLLNDAKPQDKINSEEALRRTFQIYGRPDGFMLLADALKAAKQEQQTTEMLQETFRSIDLDGDQKITFDEFGVFVNKMHWQLREKFIPGEPKYREEFQRLIAQQNNASDANTALTTASLDSRDPSIPLDQFLNLISAAGLNEIIAEAAFKQQDTSGEMRLNYEQFKHVLYKLGYQQQRYEPSQKDIQKLRELFAKYNSGQDIMRQPQFIRAVEENGIAEILAEAAFKAVDPAGSGTIDFPRFKDALLKLGFRPK